jgi:hypothetical protein
MAFYTQTNINKNSWNLQEQNDFVEDKHYMYNTLYPAFLVIKAIKESL